MLEKNLYYVSLISKEVNNRTNQREAQYEISATKSEVERLQKYLKMCQAHEEEESRLMLNPFTFTEDEEAHKEYNENLNTVLNMIYDLGTKETKSSMEAV